MMNPTDWRRARMVPATATRPSDLETICQELQGGQNCVQSMLKLKKKMKV